jgi:hypothetical protein
LSDYRQNKEFCQRQSVEWLTALLFKPTDAAALADKMADFHWPHKSFGNLAVTKMGLLGRADDYECLSSEPYPDRVRYGAFHHGFRCSLELGDDQRDGAPHRRLPQSCR